MRRIYVAFVVALVFTFCVATGAYAGADKKYTIAFANQYLGDTWCIAVQEGFVKAAAELPNVELILGNCEDDPATGLKVFDTMIARGVDAITTLTWLGIEDTIRKKCADVGIPLISCDVEYGPGTHFFGLDNLGSGRASGEMLAEWAKKNWPGEKYWLVLGVEYISGPIVYERARGAIEKVKEGLGAENIIGITELDTDTDQQLALKMFSEFLTAHPDQHHILVSTLNDESAIGYWKACEHQGRLKDVAIVGIGCDEAGIETMQAPNSNYIGAVACFPERYGECVLKVVLDILEGKEVPKYTFGPYAKVTLDNLEDYYPQYVKK